MPELPEVETIVKELNKEVLGRTFVDVWADFKKMVKRPKPSTRAKLGAGPVPHRNKVSGAGNFSEFEKEIKGKKILNIRRRAKNIIFELSGNLALLIHQKLTGHLLLGKWKVEGRKWISEIQGPLSNDPMNKFLHLIFWLDDGRQLALSDLRKFAKVELWNKEELEESKEMESLGPEPLEKDFTFEEFKEVLKKKQKGKVKQTLMNQEVIAGIGNIYSDEILWQVKIHPFKDISKLSEEELEKIYQAMREILKKAIDAKGESISDFRRITGEKGGFDPLRKVYRREGEKCPRCGAIIKRIKIGGRSAHFCPKCQLL